MAKRTLNILRCSHGKIFKVCLAILQMHERVKKKFTASSTHLKSHDLVIHEASGFFIEVCFFPVFFPVSSSLSKINQFNPFHATGHFLYPLKTSEKQKFSDGFRWYRRDQ